MSQYAFYFDQNRCTACNCCSVACKDWNQINPGLVNWRVQFTYETSVNPFFYPLSLGCNHCEDPACVAACAIGAITKDAESGAVHVDRDKCQGLESCITACPYAKPQLADNKQEPVKKTSWIVTHPMQKCDMCAERRKDGLKPICITSCVGRALEFDTIDVIQAKPGAVRLNKADFPYAYKNDAAPDTTSPALFVKKRTNTIIVHESTNYTGKPVV